MLTGILVGSCLWLGLNQTVESGESQPAKWEGFRGDGTGISTAQSVPTEWGPETISWRASLPGYGQSSPVIWGALAFVTSIDGPAKETLLVHAVRLADGKTSWSKTFQASTKGKNNPMMSRAAPTPVVDEAGIYAFFESGDIIALSHQGDVRWQSSVTTNGLELKNNHGLGGSPAQTKEALILLIDHAGPSFVTALDKKTGKTLWKTDRSSRSSWTSPVVAKCGGREVVVVSSSGTVEAYDAATGSLLASKEGITGNGIPSPCVVDGKILVGAGENRMKPDLEASRKSNCCLNLELGGEAPRISSVWQGAKALCHHASPVAYQGHAYFIDKNGILFCMDLQSGELRYSQRLPNQQWATPIAAQGRVYFFGKDGVTTIAEAGPTWKVVANNRLWSGEEFTKRQEEARKKAKAEEGKSPVGPGNPTGGPGSRGPTSPGNSSGRDLEAMRVSAVGDVVYGAAVVEGLVLIRTGTDLYCMRIK